MDPYTNLYDELFAFANKENRALHKRILAKNEELAKVSSECTDLQDRLNVLNEHLQSVQTEVKSTQELLTAKEAQATEEQHLQQLSEREYGKIVSEVGKLEEETTKVQAKNSEVQSKIFKSQQRIEAFKEEYAANEEQLQQWIQAARDKEEDYLVLQRYQKEDEGKIRSMLLEIEKSQGIVEQKRAELEAEVTQTRALQIELDMTAEQFRKLHDERNQLLSQWENTLQQLQSLNVAIEKTTEAYDSRKGETDRISNNVREEKKNLEKAEQDNKALDRRLTIGDHQVTQKHKQYEIENANLLEFSETVETQRHSLDKAESNERAIREEIEEFKRKTGLEVQKKEAYLQRLKLTKDALYTQKDSTEELQQQTNVMNEFLKKENDVLKDLNKKIEDEKQQIYKLSQAVYEERKREKNLLAEMQGSQSRAKNLQLKIQEFDRETQKQEELKYNSNFQIQQMERKISRIEGDTTEEEKVELQAKIEQLEETLSQKMSVEKMLGQQLHRLDLDLRQTSRRKESAEKQKQDLETKLTELKLDQDSLDKSTLKARSQKETVLVQINMLRLQVEKLSEQVAAKSDELISLENRRQQLQLSMQERVLEIDAHLSALRTELKTEEEARHLAITELSERKKRSETLQAKFKVMMGKYQKEGEEEPSQAANIIKFAKEREEVSRRGDELEAEVTKAVKELRALEKAMNKINGQNTKFREGFKAIDQNDADMERKKTLEEQKKLAQQRLNARRADVRRCREQHEALDQAYQQQQDKITSLQNEIQKMKPFVDKTTNENTELKEKLKRANVALTKARETHRKAENIPADANYPATLLEMDIELKLARTTIDGVVSELTTLAENNREMEPKLRLALSQAGITMRQIQQPTSSKANITMPYVGSRPASSASSIRSGASSQNSARSGTSQNSARSGTSQNSGRSATSMASHRSNASSKSNLSVHSNNSQLSVGSVRSNASNASDLSVHSSSSSRRATTAAGPRIAKPVTPRRNVSKK
ncbi:hypothetical protein TVAG_211310 [Trichomonas vaginalis G3]|uniref:Coiled-coil domain-containing protein 39 n=1 Tax=Trichomonas vaginalis (strain ATCC PRA-98 / G3) TaxID=412133 RepID=A2EKX3_TRIV3|nr:coiled-coil domain-containing protein 39 family [Trichomonas vaginalis G3]EAY06681.1 hypothetical protein TVAG_211310 [Trichomonas vaginalis G3]KAI5491725.1 coiled-coil domain-containing protein 39 family [Trichomonas vaginalis G3]|eukprot:XP_001318904.1 hypothetical protein [Trichomonas vaginalis G3]